MKVKSNFDCNKGGNAMTIITVVLFIVAFCGLVLFENWMIN